MLDRRRFLTAAAGAAAAGFLPETSQVLKAMPAAESEFGKVKVTDVKTASVMIRYPAHLVKVETDSGLYGIGEAYNRDGVVDHIEHLKDSVIGQDPLQVDYLYQRMAEAKLGHGSWTGTISSSISGIEMALWDLAGQDPQSPGVRLARRQVPGQAADLPRHRLTEDRPTRPLGSPRPKSRSRTASRPRSSIWTGRAALSRSQAGPINTAGRCGTAAFHPSR